MTQQVYQMYIGGSWREARGGARLPSVNPFSGEVWTDIPDADEQDVHDAVAAAAAAFNDGPWATMGGHGRAELLRELARLIDAKAPYLGEIETRDNGKIMRETVAQIRACGKAFSYFAGVADKILGHVIPLDREEIFDFTLHEPVGVVAVITAWNSPLHFLGNKLPAALATGNTVVIKPSEEASASTLEFARLVEEAGFPPGVVNVVTGTGARAGSALVSHPLINKISVTGGVGTGKLVAAAAAENLVDGVYELGGKSANIVFADAKLEEALAGAVAGIFGASGQTCTAGSRLLLERSIYDEFVRRLKERVAEIRLGNPLHEDTDMGPLATKQQVAQVERYVELAKKEGAVVLTGGFRPTGPEYGAENFFAPTVLVDVTNDMRIAQEEVFGPVLAVMPFEDETEAVAIANDTAFGLAAGVWTENMRRAHRMIRALKSGTVWVNTYRVSNYAAPFGGIKQSGYGREKGLDSLREFTQIKNVMINIGRGVGDPFAMRT